MYIFTSHQKNTWFCHNTKYNTQNIVLFMLKSQNPVNSQKKNIRIS